MYERSPTHEREQKRAQTTFEEGIENSGLSYEITFIENGDGKAGRIEVSIEWDDSDQLGIVPMRAWGSKLIRFYKIKSAAFGEYVFIERESVVSTKDYPRMKKAADEKLRGEIVGNPRAKRIQPGYWIYKDFEIFVERRINKWDATIDFEGELRSTKFIYKSEEDAVRAAEKMIDRDLGLVENPRRSRVKDAIAIEARKFLRFEDFEESYWKKCGRGIYWISTFDPEFRIGPREVSMALDQKLIAYCSPFEALKGANATKPYVAELDLSALDPGEDFLIVGGRNDEDYTSVIRILRADLVRTHRVIDSEKAQRVHKYQRGLLPVSKEELIDVWTISNSADSIEEERLRKERAEKRRRRKQKRGG